MTPEIDILIEDDRWIASLADAEDYTKKIVTSALEKESDKEISIVLANDSIIQTLNKDFRGKDKPTNVLSFPQNDVKMLGDVIISLDTIKREAEEQEKTLKNHYTHMLIHGTLHLLGYDHETDEDAIEMETLEIEMLENLGIKNPYETK